MNLAELRAKLELAARHKPILRKLLDGEVQSKEDLESVAAAAAELGMFELSFLVRGVAARGEHFQENMAKLALFVSSVSDGELAAEFTKRIANESPDLAAILRMFGDLER